MPGQRDTIQLAKIMDYLKSVKTHPNAEEVYLAVRKEVPSITLATVYRNLDKLYRKGLANRLEVDREFRFDGQTEGHQHCVCRECGKVLDSFDDRIPKNALKNFRKKGFRADTMEVTYKGVCVECGKKNA